MPSSTRTLRRWAVTASALALSACATVGPDFKAPDAPKGPAAAGYAMAGDPAAASVRLTPDSRVAGPWWQAFGSPELDAAVREALANNPTTAEARANLEKARAELAATRGAQLPQVDANAGAERERVNLQAFGFSGFPGLPPLSSPTINLFSIGGAVSYDLDLFGGRKRATEADQARVDRAAREADAAYLALSGNVAVQAIRIANQRAQLAAIQSVIADDRRVIDMVRKAMATGGEARSALSIGVGQLAQDEALLPPIQRDLDAARHQMALLVGKSPAEWTAPDFDLARLNGAAEVPVSLPSALVGRRPDILAAEAELHAATAEIGVAVANQYPDIKLSAALTQSAIHPGDLFKYTASGWNIGPSVSLPIFNGGTLKARRASAEAEARAAMARYQATVLRAFVQVSDLMADLGSDHLAIDSWSRANAAADSGARDAESAYRLGGGSLMQVVEAQRTVSRARRELVKVQGQHYEDLAELYAATAADWGAATPPAP